MQRISNHISYKEATKSNTAKRNGIENEPTEFQLQNMKLVADKIFEPTRNHFELAIGLSSFLRSLELNKLIGGSKNSQHLQGLYSLLEEGAIDMDADIFDNGVTNAEIFYFILDNLEFDQLIWEYGDEDEPDWVHASYREGANRKQVLVAYRENGKTRYKSYEG